MYKPFTEHSNNKATFRQNIVTAQRPHYRIYLRWELKEENDRRLNDL